MRKLELDGNDTEDCTKNNKTYIFEEYSLKKSYISKYLFSLERTVFPYCKENKPKYTAVTKLYSITGQYNYLS